MLVLGERKNTLSGDTSKFPGLMPLALANHCMAVNAINQWHIDNMELIGDVSELDEVETLLYQNLAMMHRISMVNLPQGDLIIQIGDPAKESIYNSTFDAVLFGFPITQQAIGSEGKTKAQFIADLEEEIQTVLRDNNIYIVFKTVITKGNQFEEKVAFCFYGTDAYTRLSVDPTIDFEDTTASSEWTGWAAKIIKGQSACDSSMTHDIECQLISVNTALSKCCKKNVPDLSIFWDGFFFTQGYGLADPQITEDGFNYELNFTF